MKVTMMLADAAQAVGNKLYILGGAWSITTGNIPSAVAIHIQVPWDQTSDKHTFRLELLDSDGGAVNGPDGNPVLVEAEFETGRPPGLKRGTPIDVAMAFNIPPLPLEPDLRFEWRFSIDDESRDEWRQAFSTRAAPPPGMLPLG